MTKEQLEQDLDILIRTAYFLGWVQGSRGFGMHEKPTHAASIRTARDDFVASILPNLAQGEK